MINITDSELIDALSTVLTLGDDVLIHSSLSRLGYLENGADALITSLREAVGPRGTVIMMTDTRSFARTGRFSLDQPSESGLLSERFRLTQGVRRSCVPMVSFAALGPQAPLYTEKYNSHLDGTATITRLLNNDGKILLLGIGYEKCTLYHLAEERHNVPYNFYKEFHGVQLKGETQIGPIAQRYFVRRDTNLRKDPSIAGALLEKIGAVQMAKLGNGLLRAFRARDFDDCCMQILSENPRAFLL